MLNRILPHAKFLAGEVIEPDDIVIDATCGNGHDTLFLASLVPEGKVYSFDIQEVALKSAQKKSSDYTNIEYVHDSHANVDEYVQAPVSVAMFNLGYLPSGDKTITTEAESTLAAIDKIFDLLRVGGRIIIAVYHGHPSGKEEKLALVNHLTQYDQKVAQVLRYEFINSKNNAPFLIVIEKIK